MPKKTIKIKPKVRRGRPSKFDTLEINQIKKLVLLGLDDSQISDILSITERTFSNWKAKNKDFILSLRDWKKEADLKVEKSLYQRAIGYEYDEVTYEKSNVGGLGIKLAKGKIENIKHCDTNKTKIVVKQVIPDVTAQEFWLTNRQPQVWRHRQEVSKPDDEKQTDKEISGQLGRITELLSKRKASKG